MYEPTVYDFTVRDSDGRDHALAGYRGKVLLIVNVASKCAFTPQYAGLETLYRKYAAHGFAVLGFPCNQFGGQEPATANDIRSFCQSRFGVTFPIFEKIAVNGPRAHPVYAYLKGAKPGLLGSPDIKWNFTKFLVGKDGTVVHRYAPTTRPESIAADIDAELAKQHGSIDFEPRG